MNQLSGTYMHKQYWWQTVWLHWGQTYQQGAYTARKTNALRVYCHYLSLTVKMDNKNKWTIKLMSKYSTWNSVLHFISFGVKGILNMLRFAWQSDSILQGKWLYLIIKSAQTATKQYNVKKYVIWNHELRFNMFKQPHDL